MSLTKGPLTNYKKVQFHLPSLSKSFNNKNQSIINDSIYPKLYNTTTINSKPKNIKRINKKFYDRLPMINTEVEFIDNLSIDNNASQNIIDSSLRLIKEKEKIDNDVEVNNKRIGKKYETENKEYSQDEIKSNQSREFFLKYEMLKNEKAMEDEIIKLKKNLEDCKGRKLMVSNNIINTLKVIQDYEMDIKFLNSDEYFLNIAKNNYNLDDIMMDDSKSVVSKRSQTKSPVKSPIKSPVKIKSQKNFDSFYLKTIQLKQTAMKNEQKDVLQKNLEDNITKLNNFKKQYEVIKQEYKVQKQYLEEKINFLCDYYHRKLYEGLDIRSEGLIWIMKAIWNLGKNIKLSFFPSFLDKTSIHYLFKAAHKSIEITKIKNEIQKYRKELDYQIENISRSTKSPTKSIFRTTVNNKITNTILPKIKLTNSLNDNDKKNQITLKNIGNILNEKNPLSKILEDPSIQMISNLAAGSNIIELDLINIRRAEMDRLFKEFFENNYQKKFNANLETVIGALVGEGKRDSEMVRYYRMKREYYDNMRVCQYFNLKAERAHQIQDIIGKNNDNNNTIPKD